MRLSLQTPSDMGDFPDLGLMGCRVRWTSDAWLRPLDARRILGAEGSLPLAQTGPQLSRAPLNCALAEKRHRREGYRAQSLDTRPWPNTHLPAHNLDVLVPPGPPVNQAMPSSCVTTVPTVFDTEWASLSAPAPCLRLGNHTFPSPLRACLPPGWPGSQDAGRGCFVNEDDRMTRGRLLGPLENQEGCLQPPLSPHSQAERPSSPAVSRRNTRPSPSHVYPAANRCCQREGRDSL